MQKKHYYIIILFVIVALFTGFNIYPRSIGYNKEIYITEGGIKTFPDFNVKFSQVVDDLTSSCRSGCVIYYFEIEKGIVQEKITWTDDAEKTSDRNFVFKDRKYQLIMQHFLFDIYKIKIISQ